MEDQNSILIEGSTATWDMGFLNGEIGGTYAGTFKFRCYLSPTHQLAAAREYRELLGPQFNMAPEHEGHLAYALTQLKYRVLSAPAFWDAPKQDGGLAGDIPDLNVVLAVLNAAIAAENKYRKNKEDERTGALDGAINQVENLLQEEQKEHDDRANAN